MSKPRPLFPANKLYMQQEKLRKQESRHLWLHRLPQGWIEDFMVDLEMFLKKYGYEMSYTYKDRVKYCKEWAFGHVWIQRNPHRQYVLNFVKTLNYGGQEEYEWFQHKISTYDWHDFMDKWSQWEFLDQDSSAGNKQRLDLIDLAWYMLSLEESKAHQYWLAKVCDIDTMEDTSTGFTNSEDVAYGGDRRTYS